MVQHIWKKSMAAASLVLLGTSGAVLLQVSPAQAQPAPASSAPLVRGLPDFTELVEQVGPSVVNIRTSEKVRASAGQGPDEEMQELFKRFFGVPMPNAPRQQRPNRQQPEEPQPKFSVDMDYWE